MWIESAIFYITACVVLFSGVMVISARNTVHATLFLVLAFIASSVLWILLESEFLALVLVLVYVGAVMTLFLFVVMMLNLDISPKKAQWVRYFPLGILIVAAILYGIYTVIGPSQFGLQDYPVPPPASLQYSSVSALGDILYTHYVYPFELGAVLLLTAIIAAISLSLRHPRAKRQDVKAQLEVNPKDRVELKP